MGHLEEYRRIAKKAMKAVRASSSKGVGMNDLGQETIKADRDLEGVIFAELRKTGCAVLSEEEGYREFGKSPNELFIIDPLDASENYKRGIPNYALGIACASVSGRMKDVKDAFVLDLVTGDEFYSEKGKGAWRNGKRMKPSGQTDMKQAIIAFDFYNPSEEEISDSTKAMALKATNDIRRFGPALLEMAYVACGSLEGYFNINKTLSVVHACGPALLRDSGCILSDRRGNELDFELDDVDKYFTILAAGNAKIHGEMVKIARG